MQVELICKEGFTEKATECTDYHNTETNFRIAPRTRQAPTEEHRGTGGGEQEQQLFGTGQDTIEDICKLEQILSHYGCMRIAQRRMWRNAGHRNMRLSSFEDVWGRHGVCPPALIFLLPDK